MSKPTRDQAYSALFNLVKLTPCPGGLTWAQQVRGFKDVFQVPSGSQPAMFLAKGFERGARRRQEMVTTWDWIFGLWIYFEVDPTIVDADWKFSNDLVDNLDATIQGLSGEAQMLNSLVSDCFIEGEIALYAEPETTQQQTLVVPIVIVTGD